MKQPDLVEMALTLARQMVLDLARPDRTPERFREIAQQSTEMLAAAGSVSAEDVARRLEEEFDTWVPPAIAVHDANGHIPWLDRRREEINFAYWERYKTLLSRGDNPWKPSAIEALDEATDQILGFMEDPQRQGGWRVQGLVYGQVQSGKTASYTGVICKAVDAGYQLVIVLTSQHESLRHQTQERLDREFLGFNTKFTRVQSANNSKYIGVGDLGLKRPDVICQAATTRDNDFTSAMFQGTAIDLHDVRVLVVSKKNKKILDNLYDWLANFAEQHPDGPKITNAPLLLIDDEADYASVDTRRPRRNRDHSDPDHDPTAINKGIRKILKLFEKSVYLAYTATPFANIFIPDTTNHPDHGEDLFPRSFMIALEPPSNYCGPEVVFGLENPSAAEYRDPLPVIRVVDDHETWLPDGHRKGHQPKGPLPPSLVRALDSFILATAIRKARAAEYGLKDGHNTMLVHVTRYTDVQKEVARQVQEHLRAMADTWGDRGMAGRILRTRLLRLWDRDIAPTYAELAGRDDVSALVGPRVSWSSVERLVPTVLDEAMRGIRQINGTAADVLDYQSKTPVTVVAIGGDKLSRGLTLEGLTVSYYLRASWAYDTLLQMGRWFGYRTGYLDVTRLYTTQELVDNYVHITRANRELMDLTAAVAQAAKTPKEVGMRVLDGPGNLQVTAAAKMRTSVPMLVSFAGTRPETLVMRTDKTALIHNFSKLELLVERILPAPALPHELINSGGAGLFRYQVPAQTILDFLDGFEVSPRVLSANPENLAEYIQAQLRHGELIRWTVAITSGSSKNRLSIAGQNIRLVKRSPASGTARGGELEVGVLVSPGHEEIGMPRHLLNKAFERTAEEFRSRRRQKPPQRASGDALRRLRDPAEGLLLIYPIDPSESDISVPVQGIPIVGYALHLPYSDKAEKTRYRVNKVFLDNLAKVYEEPEDLDE